ncbi:hypothetical protein NBO_2g0023 [Nosema bombycis CQ1]|uniref:Uncharacterized protein n=1 Tax=Nosema bombycis (strain CQ1 / CVCC 102059) TaxID=578461 RepID=R0KXA7_NOSB1|nr:hypothetical protein NBO_2g0023 [Nosema bombycis CQ1]|eukprot:EOB15531.1 hypothetical protein NBO_2g0023 [Nosema bombycis CQ1]
MKKKMKKIEKNENKKRSGLESKFEPKTSIFGINKKEDVEVSRKEVREKDKEKPLKEKINEKAKGHSEDRKLKKQNENDLKKRRLNEENSSDKQPKKEGKEIKKEDKDTVKKPLKEKATSVKKSKIEKATSLKKLKDTHSDTESHPSTPHKNFSLSTQKMKTPMSKIEKKILVSGTIKDKINVLSLQIERNPSTENWKNLLVYAENQRNDTIYETLKNIKDLLISKGEVKDWYVKQRIVKTFEINLKNIFIKFKVLKLVYQLLKNNIYFLELIYPFLNKLGDKKELEDFVIENCKSLFFIQKEIILENLEDFYFKNTNFKSRYSLLKLIGEVEVDLEIYIKFGEGIDLNLPEEHLKILLKLLLNGMALSLEVKNDEVKDDEGKVDEGKACKGTTPLKEPKPKKTPLKEPKPKETTSLKNTLPPFLTSITLPDHIISLLHFSSSYSELALPIFKIIYFTKPPCTREILQKILAHPPTEELLSLVFKYVLETQDKKMLKFLFNRSLLYKKEMVLAILYLINRNKVDLENYYGLSLLLNHYSLVVRKTVLNLLNKKGIREIKPFDLIDFEMHEIE